MRNHRWIAAAVLSMLAVTAPATAAQAASFSASYTDKYVGKNGTPTCPNEGFLCGGGTAASFGAYSDLVVATSPNDMTRTLTFTNGSTLVIDETFVSWTRPGQSASSHMPGFAFGFPGNMLFTWTVADSSTGIFVNAIGSGNDDFDEAGDIAHGTLSGTITTPK
jgi:hypothetical protein